MAGGATDRARERTHVVRAVNDHAFRSEFADVRSLEGGLGIVDLQIERRLVVRNDEEDVGLFFRRGRMREAGCENEDEDERERYRGQTNARGLRCVGSLS